MNNLNIFGKILKRFTTSKDEKKAKEEEDLPDQENFHFDLEMNKQDDYLDKIVSDLKIGGVHTQSWESYKKSLDNLLYQYKENIDELDLRYIKTIEKNSENVKTKEVGNVEKMKTIGKVGDQATFLDSSTMRGSCLLTYNKLKFLSKNGFTSIRTNNCVVSGKWIYEVTLNTNKLSQLGFCQLRTEFTTHNGVGDDDSSYAYDGYRNVIWHKDKKRYGELWNVGDVVGCAIDLDEKKIEFFLNGKSLGVAFKDIPVGENIAYFPGVSSSADEKITFNFGKTPFFYNYPGYESYDIPLAHDNGLVEITAELLDLLGNSILKILESKEILSYYKMTFTNKIFNFLANIAFYDDFVLKTLIVPFLCKLQRNNLEHLKIFFEHLYIYLDSKEKIVFNLNFFDNLFSYIEENAIRGPDRIDDWCNQLELVMNLLSVDFIANGWIETNNFIENLRCIFNNNLTRISDIYSHVQEKYKDEAAPKSFKKILREIKNEHLERYITQYDKIEQIYSEKIIQFLILFLSDKRQFFIKSQSKNFTLKTCLGEFVNNGHEFFLINDFINIFSSPQKDYSSFHKNFIFNLIKIHLKNGVNNKKLDDFNIEPWFSRTHAENPYHDEVGIGGTINHVTNEYIHLIEPEFSVKSEEFFNEINHRLIKIFSNILIPSITDYKRRLDQVGRAHNLTLFKDVENGTDVVDKVFRYYFYVFNESNQDALYLYSYFLIRWVNHYIKKNRNILYFIPKNVMDIPFEILMFLYNIKSSSLFDNEKRKELNKLSPIFEEDNLIYEIVYFYTYLFNDAKIANPEIRESLIVKMKFFMSKKRIAKYYEKNYELIEILIKGILNYMSTDLYCLTSCEIIIKIIRPLCFGPKGFPEEKNSFFNVAQKFFEENKSSFLDFMDSYTKIMNRAMTEYTVALNEAEQKILNVNVNQNIDNFNNDRNHYMKKFNINYSLLCDLMKIFEFILIAYPKEFFDTKSINFSRFANFLKNLASRILENFYFEKLLKIQDKMNQQNISIELISIIHSVLGIFLNIDKNKNQENFKKFIIKLSNLSDFHVEPLQNLYELIISKSLDKEIEKEVKIFKDLLDTLASSREKKRDRTMSVEEWEETTKDENICIICYANPSDMVMKPCGHICCNECLMQYLSDKNKCFICNAEIESTEERVIKTGTNEKDKMDIDHN